MDSINFFTPLVFPHKDRTASQWLCEKLDSLCWVEGQRVCVLQEGGERVGLLMGKEPDASGDPITLMMAGFWLAPLALVSMSDLAWRSINALAGTKFVGFPRLVVAGVNSAIALAAFTALMRCALHQLYLPENIQTAKQRLEKGAPQLTEEQWKLVDEASSKYWVKDSQLPEGVKRLSGGFLFVVRGVPVFVQSQVFTIDSQPGRIFKVARVSWHMNDTEKRWKNLRRAEAVRAQFGLDKLMIPRAQLVRREVDGKKYDVLVCEKLEIDTENNDYQQADEALMPALIQLGRFVLHTGFDDVEYRNAPVVGANQIGLIDLNVMSYGPTEIRTGIHGSVDFNPTGLLGLCNDAQQQAVTSSLKGHPNWPQMGH